MVSLGDINAPHQGILINIMCPALRAPRVSAGPAGQAPHSQLSNLRAHGTAISLTRLTLPRGFLGLSQQKRACRMGSEGGQMEARGSVPSSTARCPLHPGQQRPRPSPSTLSWGRKPS